MLKTLQASTTSCSVPGWTAGELLTCWASASICARVGMAFFFVVGTAPKWLGMIVGATAIATFFCSPCALEFSMDSFSFLHPVTCLFGALKNLLFLCAGTTFSKQFCSGQK